MPLRARSIALVGHVTLVTLVAGVVVACGSEGAELTPVATTGDGGTADRGAPDDDASAPPPPIDDAGAEALAPASYDPVIMVHGINGSAADWEPTIAALIAAGWPADRLIAKTFPDPSWGCNDDNAALIATWVDDALKATGSDRVDLLAHSMGTLSSRYYMEHLGGTAKVRTYATLGGMHHGLSQPCLSPLDVCVWKQLCSTGPYIADLNAEGPIALGPTKWVSIFSTDDGTVPAASSEVYGAENIQLSGITHAGPTGLQASPVVATEIERVLGYTL